MQDHCPDSEQPETRKYSPWEKLEHIQEGNFITLKRISEQTCLIQPVIQNTLT